MEAAAGALPPGSSDIGSRARQLDEEEQELWRQLRRKRDFEGRVADKRKQLEELRESRRGSSGAHTEAKVSAEHLGNQVAFTLSQTEEVGHDIAVLRESNRILEEAKATQPGGYRAKDAATIYAEEKQREEAVKAQHEQIQFLRQHLQKLRSEKASLQQRQQVLFDRQRAAEQDRNRLLGTLQDDRSEVNYIRTDRIKLWEERTKMEKEMAQILVDGGRAMLGGAPTSLPSAAPRIPGASGGVRGHVPSDSPSAFETDAFGLRDAAPAQRAPASWAGGDGAETGSSAAGVKEKPSSRPGWASFGESLPADLGAVQAGDAYAPGGPGGPAPAEPLPSFGSLGGAGGGEDLGLGGDPGVTEWSGRVKDDFGFGGSGDVSGF